MQRETEREIVRDRQTKRKNEREIAVCSSAIS